MLYNTYIPIQYVLNRQYFWKWTKTNPMKLHKSPASWSLYFNRPYGHQIKKTLPCEMGCRKCLPLSVVQLKGKHCWKPHCLNGVVDMFGHCCLGSQDSWLQMWMLTFGDDGPYTRNYHALTVQGLQTSPRPTRPHIWSPAFEFLHWGHGCANEIQFPIQVYAIIITRASKLC